MKYAVAAAALFAVASAQSLSDVPKCAIPCLDSSIKKNTDCEVTDLKCVCESFDKIQGDATTCVIKECGTETAINEVLPAAKKLCEGGASSDEKPTSSAEEAVSSAASSVASEVSSVVESASATMESSTVVTVPVEEPTGTPTPAPTGGAGDDTPVAGAAALGSVGAIAGLFLAALAL